MKRKGERLLAHLRSYFGLLAGVWTACVAGSLLWNLRQQHQHVRDMALSSAQITFENDLLYRRWVAHEGGVYVRVSEHTPPNPYLHVPERDVTTTSGLSLTLLNPSYMTRQVNEEAGAPGGSHGHITSLKPIRPENAPDAWETAALQAFEQGVEEVSSVQRMEQGEYLRLMRPFVVQKSCLKCHAAQGYSEGDIRGGISVSVPMAPLRAIGKPVTRNLALAHLGLWAVGLLGITISRRKLGDEILVREQAEAGLRLHTEALRESEQRYRTLLETAPDAVVVHRDGRFLYANDAALALTGAQSFEQLARHTVLDFLQPWDHELAVERIRLATAGERLPTREAAMLRLDAREVAIELHTTPVDFHGERAILTIIRDITERKEMEESLRQARDALELRVRERTAELMQANERLKEEIEEHARTEQSLRLEEARLDALLRLSRFSEASLTEIAGFTLEQAIALTQSEIGFVGSLSEDEAVYTIHAVSKDVMKQCRVAGDPMQWRVADAGIWAEAIRERKTLFINDYDEPHPGKKGLPPGHPPVKKFMVVPVFDSGKIVVVAGVGNKASDYDRSDERQIVLLLSGMWGYVQKNRSREALQKAHDELEETVEQRTAELRELNATLESRVAERTAELEHRTRQLQKLALELSQAEDRERKRVAAILHEDLQQQIAGAKFHLGLLNGQAGQDPKHRATVARVDQMLKEAIEKSRTLSHELSPVVLHRNDLMESLGWLAWQMQSKHGLTVHVDPRGEMLLQSEALAVFLFRAAQEMLFNAIKHARVGEARLRVRRLGRYICLSVSDQGRGFDPQTLSETTGFGLLSIRERIELLGGRMKIRSLKGKGSTLLVVVPDGQEPAGVGPRARPMPAGHHRGSPLRVLLVDDHDVVREGLAALLAEAGDIEVVGEAPDGREAVDQAVRLQPDVILMDVFMPMMNGDEAARQIRTHLPQMRIVALSMLDEEALVERMQLAGAEAYVLKTAPAEALFAAIRGKAEGLGS